MKKSKIAKAVLFITMMLLCTSATGCAIMTVENFASKESIYKSDDKNETITAPFAWSNDDDLNEDSILHISNVIDDDYVVVIKDTKDSLGEDIELNDYADLVKSNLENEIKDADSSELKDVEVNGYHAKYFKLAGEYSDTKITYLYYCVETSDSFYQVIGWSSTTGFKDNEDEIKKIMNSFKAKKEL